MQKMCLRADICLNPSFTLRLGSGPGWCSATMEGRVAAGSLWDVVFPAATMTLGLAYPDGTGFLKSWMVLQHVRVVFLKSC